MEVDSVSVHDLELEIDRLNGIIKVNERRINMLEQHRRVLKKAIVKMTAIATRSFREIDICLESIVDVEIKRSNN